MTASGIAREVYSDHDFNIHAACAHCGEPVQREEEGRILHPVLAIATPDTGHDFDAAITLCSGCLGDDGFESCFAEALERADDPGELRYLFQVLGVPAQQELIRGFIHSLDRDPQV